MAYLEASGLTVRYGGVTALESVSLKVERAEIVALLGPNGSGKTTLLDCLSGVRAPDAGHVVLDGVTISGLAPHRVAALGVARVFQAVQLVESADVLENVLLGAHRRVGAGALTSCAGGWAPRPADRQRRARDEAVGVLQELGIEDIGSRTVAGLGFGDRRWVELARALLAEPTVLLLDEPSTGLSAVERRRLADVLASLRSERGVAVVLVSHDDELPRSVADRIVRLENGRLSHRGAERR